MLAIVLSRHDFRESDQIISLYTFEQGKKEMLARGVKKITSKNAAALLPFSLVEVEIVPGKEIDHLTTAQSIKVFINILQHLEKITVANYICQLAHTFILPNEKDENIFNVLVNFLNFLDVAEKVNNLTIVSGFIIKLWHCLGFGATNEKHNRLLKDDWNTINALQLSEKEQRQLYESACAYAELHAGRRLPRLIDAMQFSC